MDTISRLEKKEGLSVNTIFMLQSQDVDFLVIGSGPAGQKGAIQAKKEGKKVVVIESCDYGGSSLWSGTIPSKSLREAIIDLSRFQQKSFYKNQLDVSHISITDLNFRVHWVQDHIKMTMQRQMEKNGIQFIRGVASFENPHQIVVRSDDGKTICQYKGASILLAPGSQPRVPKGIPFDDSSVFNSTTILQINRIPHSLLVLGAGVIGCEYASMFCLLGCRVTLVDARPCLLSFLDQEIGTHLQLALQDNHLQFLGDRRYTSIEKVEGEKNYVRVNFENSESLYSEAVLVAAGREANVEGLDLEKAGLSLNSKGYIDVDAFYQTAVSHIFAAGDVIGGPCLASVSYEQGRLAALNAFEEEEKHMMASSYPYGIYTIPEVASIGKTEEQVIEESIPYEVGRAYFYEVSRSVILGNEYGLCKLIFHLETLELLGVHIVGLGATEAIHLAQLAISFNVKIEYFLKHVFNFPTFMEMYRIAALNGINKCKKGSRYGNL